MYGSSIWKTGVLHFTWLWEAHLLSGHRGQFEAIFLKEQIGPFRRTGIKAIHQ